MKFYQSLVVISLTTLITTFTMTSIASDDDAGKDDAVKDKGVTLSSSVSGCSLTIADPDVILYSNRSLKGIPISKVPLGSYSALDYKPGWYKIRAQGWIGWIQDPSAGPKKTAMLKSNCPGKN